MNFYKVEKGTEQYSYISNLITDELKANGISGPSALQSQTEDFLKGLGLTSEEISALKDNLSATI